MYIHEATDLLKETLGLSKLSALDFLSKDFETPFAHIEKNGKYKKKPELWKRIEEAYQLLSFLKDFKKETEDLDVHIKFLKIIAKHEESKLPWCKPAANGILVEKFPSETFWSISNVNEEEWSEYRKAKIKEFIDLLLKQSDTNDIYKKLAAAGCNNQKHNEEGSLLNMCYLLHELKDREKEDLDDIAKKNIETIQEYLKACLNPTSQPQDIPFSFKDCKDDEIRKEYLLRLLLVKEDERNEAIEQQTKNPENTESMLHFLGANTLWAKQYRIIPGANMLIKVLNEVLNKDKPKPNDSSIFDRFFGGNDSTDSKPENETDGPSSGPNSETEMQLFNHSTSEESQPPKAILEYTKPQMMVPWHIEPGQEISGDDQDNPYGKPTEDSRKPLNGHDDLNPGSNLRHGNLVTVATGDTEPGNEEQKDTPPLKEKLKQPNQKNRIIKLLKIIFKRDKTIRDLKKHRITLAKEIKKLRKENTDLNGKLEDLNESAEDAVSQELSLQIIKVDKKRLEEENEKLEEENEKLKIENQELITENKKLTAALQLSAAYMVLSKLSQDSSWKAKYKYKAVPEGVKMVL